MMKPETGRTAPTASQASIVSLGTATPGGGFPLYGAAFADTVNATDPSLAVTPRNTRGSTENVPLLEAGKLLRVQRHLCGREIVAKLLGIACADHSGNASRAQARVIVPK